MAPTHTPHCKPSRYPGPRSPLPTLPSAHCPNQNICPIFSPAHQPAKGGPYASKRTQARPRRTHGQHQRPQGRSPLGPPQGRPHRHVPATRRSKPTSPHSVVSSATPSAWPPGRCTRPCWRLCSVPPPGATPLLAYLRKTTPGPTGLTRDPRPKSIKGGPSNSFGKGALAEKTIAVLPHGQLQKSTKKHKAILQREINQYGTSAHRGLQALQRRAPQPSPHKAVAPATGNPGWRRGVGRPPHHSPRYCPVHWGLRFSAKARGPSMRSWESSARRHQS